MKSLILSKWLPLLSIGKSFWLQIQRSRVRFSTLLDFWEVVHSRSRVPLSLVMINENPHEWNVAAPVWKTGIHECLNSLRWPRDTLLLTKVATNYTDHRRPSVAIVLLRTQSHRIYFFCVLYLNKHRAMDSVQSSGKLCCVQVLPCSLYCGSSGVPFIVM
jgi:hypothetical protein